MQELPCIVCDQPLGSVYSGVADDHVNTPYAGTVFLSGGGYGSTVYDPMSQGMSLEVTICDKCLVEKKDKVLHRIMSRGAEYRYEPWRGTEEGGEQDA